MWILTSLVHSSPPHLTTRTYQPWKYHMIYHLHKCKKKRAGTIYAPPHLPPPPPPRASHTSTITNTTTTTTKYPTLGRKATLKRFSYKSSRIRSNRPLILPQLLFLFVCSVSGKHKKAVPRKSPQNPPKRDRNRT